MVFDKLKFWKKDDFADEIMSRNDDPLQQPNDPMQGQTDPLQQPTDLSQGPLQDDSFNQQFGTDGQYPQETTLPQGFARQPAERTYDRPDYRQDYGTQQPAAYGQRDTYLEMINAKLDAVNAKLDHLRHRLEKFESDKKRYW